MKRLPTVIWHDKLPEWIASSEYAAYHPYGNAIHIRNDMGLRTLMHEYTHWLICSVFGEKMECLHKLLDR